MSDLLVRETGLGVATAVDTQAAVEHFFTHGWTDGLPVVPPSTSAVMSMLAAGHLEAEAVLGLVPQRRREITAGQAALAAVMAGARPEYFPVILATWDAVLDPAFNLHAVLASTAGPAITGIVSGPYAETIGMNARYGLVGTGNRANSTIGRAIRLGAIIALDAIVGEVDAACFGQGGQYSAHFAESSPPEPWLSIREQLGYPADSTTVTVLPTDSPRQIAQHLSEEPEDLLCTIAACIRNPSQFSTGKGTYYVIVLGPEHADILCSGGWSQADIRGYLGAATRVTPDELAAAGVRIETDGSHDMTPGPDGKLPVAEPPDILIVTAGGHGPGWSLVVPCEKPKIHTHPVTRAVHLPGQQPVVCDADACQVDFL